MLKYAVAILVLWLCLSGAAKTLVDTAIAHFTTPSTLDNR